MTGFHTCGKDGSCKNTIGSYICVCNKGYENEGNKLSKYKHLLNFYSGPFCADVDECLLQPCDENAVCNNRAGSYDCSCKTGFSGDGFECQDTDECSENVCDENADCVNVAGFYTCSCKIGIVVNCFFSNVKQNKISIRLKVSLAMVRSATIRMSATTSSSV